MARLLMCHYPLKIYRKKPPQSKNHIYFKHSMGTILKLLCFIFQLHKLDLYGRPPVFSYVRGTLDQSNKVLS